MNVVIAPHADDEVLGCGGILDSNFHVYYCGIDEFHVISMEDRLKEIEEVAGFLNFSYEVADHQTVNRYDGRVFIDIFQDLINLRKPEKIFIPYTSYNQDHQEIYHAAMIALRPHDKNFFVKKVLVYEGLDCFWMNPKYEVNHFVPIDIEAKITAYQLHQSQVREHRSLEAIRALAVLRGAMIGAPHAEAFIVKRWVE